MNFSKWSVSVVAIALTVGLALGVDWIAAELLNVGSSVARWWLLAATLVLVCGALAFLLAREFASRKHAAHDLEVLGRTEAHRLTQTNVSFRDETHVGDDLNRAVGRLQDKLRSLARQIEELERERTAYQQLAKGYEAQYRQARTVLSALAEPVLVIDKRDQLVLTNSSANRLLEIDEVGRDRQALASLVRCEELVELLHDARRTRTFTEAAHEIEVTDREGNAHWYRVTTRNIPTQPGDSDPDGTSQGAVALLHDISAQRRRQKRNAEFVTAVSHEMRTPLASITAYTELLADGEADGPQAQQHFLRVIASQTSRLNYLVGNLVDLARIEADLAGTQRSDVLLSNLVEEAAAGLRALAESKQLQFEVQLQKDIMLSGVDRQLVLQAIVHLLSNAVKYTPPSGSVKASCLRMNGRAVIEVRDTGVGLSEAEQSRIFEKFYRADSAREMGEGSGLGLPLVKHIVEDVHDGTVTVESTPGQGSVFRIMLDCISDNASPDNRPGQVMTSSGDLST